MRAYRQVIALATAVVAAVGCEGVTDPYITNFTVNITGVVRDGATGEPIEGVTVKARVKARGFSWETFHSVVADKDITAGGGRFALRCEDRGSCGLECPHDGSRRCTGIQIVTEHDDYERDSFHPRILCNSEPQTVPDLEIRQLSG
jgi:hypothetical protein